MDRSRIMTADANIAQVPYSATCSSIPQIERKYIFANEHHGKRFANMVLTTGRPGWRTYRCYPGKTEYRPHGGVTHEGGATDSEIQSNLREADVVFLRSSLYTLIRSLK